MSALNLEILLPVVISLTLVWAMATDIRHRIIPNWVVLGVVALAPMMWVVTDLALWPDIGLRVLIAALCFALFAAIFATGKMGGGDVKLISALSLWFGPQDVIWFLIAMSLIGGILSFGLLVHAKLGRRPTPDVPYGVAISLSALAVLLGPLR